MLEEGVPSMFQSHNGLILTIGENALADIVPEFQSHNGLILTLV